MSRRTFLTGAAALGAGAALGAPPLARALPHPTRSGIKHVVWVMMENRSFDHFLGWLPGANGRQAGLVYTDRHGARHATHRLAPDFQGCAFGDPDHSYHGGRVEWNGGRCDGWLRVNDRFAIGYYTAADLGFWGQAAGHWTVLDRYFASIMAETLPNRVIQHAGQTDRIADSLRLCHLPTIWDRLAARGVSHRYYFGELPVLALWGTRYLGIGRPFAAFLDDAAAGTLPAVCYVDPPFAGQARGTSSDDHPHADVRRGEAFLHQVYRAVTRGPGWPHTVLIISYDEWGGFFDHVPPPVAPLPAVERAAGNADGLLGFRVPALIVSPWSRRGVVSHTIFDHTSVLKFIEWRWGLAPLSVRDRDAHNLAQVLDFAHPRLDAPHLAAPRGPFAGACP